VISRDRAWTVLAEFTKSDSLRKHARAVETAMRAYARRYGEDLDEWGLPACSMISTTRCIPGRRTIP